MGVSFSGWINQPKIRLRSEPPISSSLLGSQEWSCSNALVSVMEYLGHPYANRRLIGRAVTEAVMRLIPHDPEDAGYIFTYLATGFGQRLVMRHSAGTSIPVLQEDGASKILIYWPDKTRRLQIHHAATIAGKNELEQWNWRMRHAPSLNAPSRREACNGEGHTHRAARERI